MDDGKAMGTKIKPLHEARAGTSPVDRKTQLNIHTTYPYSDKYEYTTQLVRRDLDATRINDLKTGLILLSMLLKASKMMSSYRMVFSHLASVLL